MATPLPPPSAALASTLADWSGGRIAVPLTTTGSSSSIPSSRRRFLTQLAAAVLLSVALLWVDVRQFVGRRGGVRESGGFGGGIGSVVLRRGEDVPMVERPESDIDDESISRDALAFVMSRKDQYDREGVGVNWKLRGVGFLYEKRNVVLAARVVNASSVVIFNALTRARAAQAASGTKIGGGGMRGIGSLRDDCDELTVWVRVYGPEIFAGSARAVPATEASDCSWRFNFTPTVPGTYFVDAKVLLWGSKNRDYETEQACAQPNAKPGLSPGDEPASLSPLHAGFKGFKFYFPTASCCEICNRQHPYCDLWRTPPLKIAEPTRLHTGCELYFRPDTPEHEIPRSWLLGDLNRTIQGNRVLQLDTTYGIPHGAEPQHFLGCGWSYWHTLDFPCLSGELDDRIFLLNDTFVVPESATHAQHKTRSSGEDSPLPLCQPDAERMDRSDGRWVQEPFPNASTCLARFRVLDKYSSRYDVYRYNGSRPHCWHREAISRIGLTCAEPNCFIIDKSQYWNSRARVPRWMGVWREFSCDYVEFTDSQLQDCINRRKITALIVKGVSVAENLNVMVQQRLDPMTMYANATDPESMEVTVTTLGLLHKTMMNNSMVRNELRRMTNATSQKPVYVYGGYYTTSEREPYTHVERMIDLNRIVEEELIPKGYTVLNMFALSAAWGYDADGQRDGMHIVGPPMRMGVTKLFHYMCADVVEGSRV